MTEGLPLAHSYNLARLGNAGDTVSFAADEAQRGAVAKWSGVLSVEKFETQVDIRRLGPNHFGLEFALDAAVTQACVVTLEPVPARLERRFSRELHFVGPARHKPVTDDSGPDLVLDSAEEEAPEEIESLHYDLAGPVLEEYVLALDPYPRRPGVEFTPETGPSDRPESPFAVLKSLK